MNTKIVKIPGPDHPITIEPGGSRVIVTVSGVDIASSRDALLLREGNYPPVLYIPRKDIDMTLLRRTDHSTYCPYKGDCSYYSVPSGGDKSIDEAWTYEEPYAAVAAIRGHLAFYANRVDSVVVRPG